MPLRTYQLMRLIEPETGFYTGHSSHDPHAVYSARRMHGCAGGNLLFERRCTCAAVETEKYRPWHRIASLRCFAGGGCHFSNRKLPEYSLGAHALVIQQNTSLFLYLIKTGGFALIFEVLFAVLSCVFFLFFGYHYITGKLDYSQFKLLAVAPLCWIMALHDLPFLPHD